VSRQTPAKLDAAAGALAAAAGFLAEWHARQTDVAAHHSYVAAGHDCIAAIDGALRGLYDARAALVTEIREDEIDRNIRVDELLARIAAERAPYSRDDDPVTNGPLPAGVEGRPLGRHATNDGVR
jgi:hypothetical protein